MWERTQKLLRLAQALEILRERLLADAADPTTAAALPRQFSGTLAELPKQLTRAAIGLEADFDKGAIRVEYETRQGDRYRDDTATIKLRMQF